ncbi:MAG: retroviral-like aspartic protease family protein [Flavobacteriaceae bacterium]|nr:retroviral-like aspartic protease family protein [Flavobacteriaceae bacterium]
MKNLKEFLFDQGYYRVKLKKTATNHFEIKVKINNVKGRFILDTGASNSCVGFDDIEIFHLKTEESEHKASGAGSTEIETLISKKNTLKIGAFKLKKSPLILIDLSHINNALIKQKANPVQGIIGADILHKGKAIIDYNKKYLYLLNKNNKNEFVR